MERIRDIISSQPCWSASETQVVMVKRRWGMGLGKLVSEPQIMASESGWAEVSIKTGKPKASISEVK